MFLKWYFVNSRKDLESNKNFYYYFEKVFIIGFVLSILVYITLLFFHINNYKFFIYPAGLLGIGDVIICIIYYNKFVKKNKNNKNIKK